MHPLDDAIEEVFEKLPEQFCEGGRRRRAQLPKVKLIIETYGPHPHRNDILSRHSMPQEALYVSVGDFPYFANSSR